MTDITQSPGDRLRFEILLKSLTEGTMNLAVLSQHDMVLDFYGNLFDERLRAKGETDVEFCFSTNSETLVQKFNEILSDLTLNEALEKEKKHVSRRYLIFRDSILMQDFELQLLARLVNGFPASNITVILLINSAGNYRSKLEAFGKNLLQWEVETKAGEPKQAIEDWVADTSEPVAPERTTSEPDVAPASKLLNVMAKPSWRIPGFGGDKKEPVLDTVMPAATALAAHTQRAQAASASADTSSVTSSSTTTQTSARSSDHASHSATATGNHAGATARAPGDAASSAWQDTPREPALLHEGDTTEAMHQAAAPTLFEKPARRMPWGWITLALLLSLGVFAYMHRDAVMQEAEQFKKYLLRGTASQAMSPEEVASAQSAAEAAAEAASAAAVAASAEAAASAPIEAAAPTAPPAAIDVATTTTTTPVVPSAQTTSQPASASDSAPTPAPTPSPSSKEAARANKKSAAVSDEAWVKQLTDNSYVLQLSAADTEEDILKFKNSHPVYANLRVMSAPKKDSKKRYFILVAGPFENKTAADTYINSHPLLSKGWLRNAKSMRNQFLRPQP